MTKKQLENELAEARRRIAELEELTVKGKETEKALRESDEFNTSLLSGSPNPIIVINPDRSIKYTNPALEKITGFTSSELIGLKTPYPWWTEETLEKTSKDFKEAMSKGAIKIEELFKKKDGTRFWVEITSSSIMRNGTPIHYIANWVDITERKRAEEALQGSDERFRDIALSSSDWIWEVDAEGRYTFASGRVMEALGFHEQELIGKTPFDLMHEEEAKRVGDIFAEISARKRRIVDLVNWNLHKDGHLVCLLTNGVPILDENGGLLGYRGVDKDITERKQMEEALRNSEKWLSTTLSSIGDAVITTDTEGRVTFINPVARSLTGWDHDEAAGQTLDEVFNVVNEWTSQPVANPVAEVLKEGKIVGLANHTILISKDGTERPIADSGAPITDEAGRIMGVVLVFRDISEQRQVEARLRQQQKLESIGTLAGGVAHEINNPVSIIMNNAELILDDVEQDGESEKCAREIIRESQRIATIVRNLLAFSRQEKETHSPADIENIVESTLSLARKVLQKNQITIEIDIPEDLPRIKCRSQQIQQVIMNLVTNAQDALNQRYTGYDENKILEITAGKFIKNDTAWIRLTVEDHGSGIPSEIMNRIFDPFFTTKPQDKGTGLGLSISHGIAQDHRGELWAQSTEGEYTRFHLELPVDNGWSTKQPDKSDAEEV